MQIIAPSIFDDFLPAGRNAIISFDSDAGETWYVRGKVSDTSFYSRQLAPCAGTGIRSGNGVF
ncbi:hypothetical protein AA14362_0628 [Acetobacter cerevisiae DSM 14362]|nr:hypothetical protein AA14362_0628 [Acetobacter cerevisiae DSM 14362]